MEGIVEFESDWAILELHSSRLIVKGGFTLGFGPKTSLKWILFLVETNKIWWKSGATSAALHFFIPWTQILV